VSARCRGSGDAGVDAGTFDFDGGRTVTRAFTLDVSPVLLRVGLCLNGDVDRGVTVVLTVILLVLATELELEGLRAMVALLFTLAFGLKVVGGGERDDWDVIWPLKGDDGRDGGLELEATL